MQSSSPSHNWLPKNRLNSKHLLNISTDILLESNLNGQSSRESPESFSGGPGHSGSYLKQSKLNIGSKRVLDRRGGGGLGPLSIDGELARSSKVCVTGMSMG